MRYFKLQDFDETEKDSVCLTYGTSGNSTVTFLIEKDELCLTYTIGRQQKISFLTEKSLYNILF